MQRQSLLQNYKLLITAAAICALIASVLAVNEWKKVTSSQEVLVVSSEIQEGTAVTLAHVIKQQRVKRDLQEDVITNLSQIEGKVARGVIPAGTVLRQAFFCLPDDLGIEGMLNKYPGRHAYAFPSSINTTVGGEVKPESLVDIYALKKEQSGKIVSNIPVLTVNEDAVVIALTPQEIEKINQAIMEEAVLKFVLLPKERRQN